MSDLADRTRRATLPTLPAMSRRVAVALEHTRNLLALALLARCSNLRQASVLPEGEIAITSRHLDQAANAEIEMASSDLARAAKLLDEGNEALAVRTIVSASVHAKLAVEKLAVEWITPLSIDVPPGAITAVRHVEILADVAREVGRDGPAELVEPATRTPRPKIGRRPWSLAAAEA